jgi:hypothetical protein
MPSPRHNAEYFIPKPAFFVGLTGEMELKKGISGFFATHGTIPLVFRHGTKLIFFYLLEVRPLEKWI